MKTITNEAVAGEEGWLGVVREQVASLRFGVVQIVVHEGRIVQIERTEKLRLDQSVSAVVPTKVIGGSNQR